MKRYFIKFVLWQAWAVTADYLFWDKAMAVFAIVFFLIVDIACGVAYVVKKRRGDDMEASLRASFDIIPYKWFGIATFAEAITWIHWEEHAKICAFLWVTVLIGYAFDTMDRYHEWKRRQE